MTSEGGEREHFDELAAGYDRIYYTGRAPYRVLIERKLEFLDRKLSGDILEIGPGTGRFTEVLSVPGNRVVGVDFSRNMLGRLRRRLEDRLPGLVCADATRLPFRDGSFDGALAVAVLFHIPNWRQALVEIHRILREGGTAVIEMLNVLNPVVLLRNSVWRLGKARRARGARSREPVVAATYDQIERFLTRTGFVVEEVVCMSLLELYRLSPLLDFVPDHFVSRRRAARIYSMRFLLEVKKTPADRDEEKHPCAS